MSRYMQFSISIPHWCRWIAQDKDGAWWAYEKEPNLSLAGIWHASTGRGGCIASCAAPKDFTQELYRVK